LRKSGNSVNAILPTLLDSNLSEMFLSILRVSRSILLCVIACAASLLTIPGCALQKGKSTKGSENGGIESKDNRIDWLNLFPKSGKSGKTTGLHPTSREIERSLGMDDN